MSKTFASLARTETPSQPKAELGILIIPSQVAIRACPRAKKDGEIDVEVQRAWLSPPHLSLIHI